MTMHNPAHPGEVLRETCIKPLKLTVQEAADGLGVTRKALSDLLNVIPVFLSRWRSGLKRPDGVPLRHVSKCR
jgi:hypothetical protein